MTVASVMADVRTQLAAAGIPDPQLEARSLLRAALKLSQAELLAARDRPLTLIEYSALESLVARRREREPLQYITGKVEFYGRDFSVDKRVLIPRPETELLVEQALATAEEIQGRELRVLDIGTGSGIIAVTMAAELPEARVVATDISNDSLSVAKANARHHRVDDRIQFTNCFIADGVTGHFDIVLSNPPYVLSGYLDSAGAQPELASEPRMALDGGAEGMDVYRELFKRLGSIMAAHGTAFIEIDPPVVDGSLEEARTHLPRASRTVLTDLAGLERCLVLQLPR